MTARTGGRYVRDPKTGQLTQVEGPAQRAAEEARAAAAKPKAPPAPKATAATTTDED